MEEGDEIDHLCRRLVPATYIQQGLQALKKRHDAFRHLLQHRKLPQQGWDEALIDYVVTELALMDR